MGAALDDDAGARRMGHRRQHGGRRGDANAGAVIDDHQRQEPIEVAGDRSGSDRQRQRRQNEAVGEALGVVLHAGVADRRGLHEMGDLARRGVDADAQRAHAQLSVAKDGGGEHCLAFAAGDRQAFAGDGLLVDRRASFDDLAVDGDHFAGINHHEIADRQFARRDRDDFALAHDPGGFGLEFEQFGDRASRAGRGQVADPIAELDQPGNDGAGERVALHDRRGDRQRIEKIDVQPALAPPDPPGANRDRKAVPQHQRQIDRHDNGIAAEGHQ